jgi:glutathione synthase/RimK-type ligase-like ATP-grasp enzyme
MTLSIIGQDKSESNLRLLEEAKKSFDSVFFVPLDGISIGLNQRFSIHYRATDMQKFKSVLPRIPKPFSSYGYQILSLFPGDSYMAVKPITYLLAAERFFLLTVLRKRGISTINLNMARSTIPAIKMVDSEKYPMIIRTTENKTGVVVKNRMEAKSIIDALAHLKQPILVEDVSRDIVSAFVAEPEVVAAVRKKSKSTDILFAPGELKSHKLSIDAEQLAIDTARSMDAHVARVDMSINGEPRVINVDLCPDLVKPSKASGVNIPRKIIESVHANQKSYSEKPMLLKFFEDAKSVVRDVLHSKNLI